jgi:hypothetical protein
MAVLAGVISARKSFHMVLLLKFLLEVVTHKS